ncbi:hypothetical protein K502DRAFT_353445 [Neoconidiobolus thromboides FSU 785]|nr:hypothetical protein K502DRAFT_353445 [Neoconidiobolus thromboides FSU 785]
MIRLVYKKIVFLILVVLITASLLYANLDKPFIGVYKSGFKYNNGKIPKIIHQTWKDKNIQDVVAKESWEKMNPEYEYKLHINKEYDEYVKERFPDIYPLYMKLPKDIMRFDLSRYLLIYDEGGIYSDIDTECIKPIDEWTKNYENVGAIIGIELDASDHIVPWFSPVQLQLMQWTFAASPHHPIIQHVINGIAFSYSSTPVEELEKISVHDTTGPSIWTKLVLDYLCKLKFCNWRSLRNLEEPVLIDDVLILPPFSFNPYTDMRPKGPKHKYSYVIHKFLGSWK